VASLLAPISHLTSSSCMPFPRKGRSWLATHINRNPPGRGTGVPRLRRAVSSATHKTALEAAGGHPRLGIHAKLPLDEAAIAVAADVLEEVAEGARSLWGHMTPHSADGERATSPCGTRCGCLLYRPERAAGCSGWEPHPLGVLLPREQGGQALGALERSTPLSTRKEKPGTAKVPD
jgi:hypothetical protein